MIGFFTSSPTGPLDNSYSVDGMDPKNGFIDRLRRYYKPGSDVLMIAADPTAFAQNDQAKFFFRWSLEHCGFEVGRFDFLDDRCPDLDPGEYDVVYLSGGHVPTEHAFFERIDLKRKLKNFPGIVIGISAGTMNSAENVYCMPEEPGETAVEFPRWLEGLGLCKTNVIPHFQMIRHDILDGKRILEDVLFLDSYGQNFLCLEDGSYLFCKDGNEYVCGKAFHIHDGIQEELTEENQIMDITDPS